MKENLNYLGRSEIHTFPITYLDEETILKMISFIRQSKQVDAKCIMLEFSKDLRQIAEKHSISERLSWSKTGQLLTRFISNSPVPVYGIACGDTFDEYLEILLSCSTIFSLNDNKFSFFKDSLKQDYLTRFGTLKLLIENNNKLKNNSLLLPNLERYANELLSEKVFNSSPDINSLKVKIDLYLDEISDSYIHANRLWAVNNSSLPLNISSYEYVEATMYSNQPFSKILNNKIKTQKSPPVNPQSLNYENQKDDLANDYLNMSSYPDKELDVLNKKSRLTEVDILIKQDLAPIAGRCIELGSGYGYFAASISKSSKVSESVGLDISLTEILQLGPYVWEKLEPDWDKFKFLIADMNTLEEQFGTYDTVIFCASLHHSSDIPLSLEIANKLLKSGGSLIIHGEHVRPVFFSPKKHDKGLPQTIPEFNKALFNAGFDPKVFRYALPKSRFPYWLKNFLFTKFPFKYFNGWVRFSEFIPMGIKK